MSGSTAVGKHGDTSTKIRRGTILGIVITVLFFPMGLTNFGEAFALELRVYGYVIYRAGDVISIGFHYLPLYLYMWRVSSLLFLAWIITYIAYIIKPSMVLDSSGIIYGISYVITHYIYLFTIGAPIIIYPFVYSMVTVGKPLLYLDWGQVIAIITIWRVYTIRRLVRG
ncbi:hypothetical protein [Vulcanisaeta souniana]|uniref:Uncharacterized protein n=1 Tax=Vulcanisaeta souniana JCM 11219 TaxID=1293586 RepID=A0A830E4Z4_9CREN|nr:hypothetical protein [Vulcanisaeta souniana]BDR93113.1 hypothetical protein Vsou_22060 [Vulcanisaeta souniana JCM 11219]GGI86861.1 hypothetical protein GCM10007112_24730 [Vulcanisaeta souniana JCM 11219]